MEHPAHCSWVSGSTRLPKLSAGDDTFLPSRRRLPNVRGSSDTGLGWLVECRLGPVVLGELDHWHSRRPTSVELRLGSCESLVLSKQTQWR